MAITYAMPVELRGNPGGLICKGSTRLGLLSQVGFTAQVVLHWQPFVRSSVIPGFKPFTDLLVQFYGFYGYSVSTMGIVIGAFWGLIEGFVHFGIFAWLYNMLLGRRVSASGAP